jgi:hypothetical protein
MTTPEMVRRLRDGERNPPDMAWRNEIADRLEHLASVVSQIEALVEKAVPGTIVPIAEFRAVLASPPTP